MVAVKRLRGALANALSALVSRNGEIDGWWMWGVVLRQLVDRHQGAITLDLAARPEDPVDAAVVAVVRDRLVRQLRLSRCGEAWLARVELRVALGVVRPDALCWDVDVALLATLSDGRGLDRQARVRAWPHDPAREGRSGRWVPPARDA